MQAARTPTGTWVQARNMLHHIRVFLHSKEHNICLLGLFVEVGAGTRVPIEPLAPPLVSVLQLELEPELELEPVPELEPALKLPQEVGLVFWIRS